MYRTPVLSNADYTLLDNKLRNILSREDASALDVENIQAALEHFIAALDRGDATALRAWLSDA